VLDNIQDRLEIAYPVFLLLFNIHVIHNKKGDRTMSYLDKLIVNEMTEDIEESVFSDEMGEFIDSLADLETDKDIIDRCIGGNEGE
jgi:hypothetical protein